MMQDNWWSIDEKIADSEYTNRINKKKKNKKRDSSASKSHLNSDEWNWIRVGFSNDRYQSSSIEPENNDNGKLDLKSKESCFNKPGVLKTIQARIKTLKLLDVKERSHVNN